MLPSSTKDPVLCALEHAYGKPVSKGARIQVFFDAHFLEQIEDLAKAEGVSLSKVVNDCFQAYSHSESYELRLDAARKKLNALKNEVLQILGPDIDESKLKQVIDAIDRIK